MLLLEVLPQRIPKHWRNLQTLRGPQRKDRENYSAFAPWMQGRAEQRKYDFYAKKRLCCVSGLIWSAYEPAKSEFSGFSRRRNGSIYSASCPRGRLKQLQFVQNLQPQRVPHTPSENTSCKIVSLPCCKRRCFGALFDSPYNTSVQFYCPIL